MLRRIASRSAQHQRNASNTSTSTTTPLITSRQLYQDQLSHHPAIQARIEQAAARRKAGASKHDTSNDKPWPKSVRIAGYAALATAVPMGICTIVSEFPGLREWLVGEKPHDPNDSTYGKQLVAFVEKYWSAHGHFENNRFSSMQERANVSISRLLHSPVLTKLYVMDYQPLMQVKLPGNLAVNVGNWHDSDAWKQATRGALVSSQMRPLAIEFPDDETLVENSSYDEQDQDEASTPTSPYSLKLRQLTHTFSAWHAFDPTPTDTGLIKSTPEENRIAELEWNEAQLISQLIDPYCTRDIDEMQTELAQIKLELRRLKRFRWARSLFKKN